MAATVETLLSLRGPALLGSGFGETVKGSCHPQYALFNLRLARSLSRPRSSHHLCRAALDLQPQKSTDNGYSALSFAPQASELPLQTITGHERRLADDSSLADSGELRQGEQEPRFRRGNVDKKSARKWVRESIEWEATGMRTRGRAEEILKELSRLRVGASIDDVMAEYAGRASVESLNDVVKGLGRLDDWQRSLSVFEWMQGSRFQHPNAHTYTNIISILGRSRQVAAAERIFDGMKQEGVKRNIFHYNAMLACYTRNRLVPEALSLFQEMEERQLPLDAYTYSNMINACVKGQLGLGKALQLFDRMERSGLKGDLVVYSSLLHACVKAGRVSEAERVREEMGKAGHSPNLYIYTEMIKLYARAGNWRSAESMFYDMKRKKQKMDSTLYTAMIDAYGRCGQYDEALSVFYDMRTAGYDPDVVTYSALVAACAAIGDYTEAGSIVEVMVNSGVFPNAFTYTSLIQAAGRANQGDDISMLLGQMREAGFEPTAVTHAVLVDAFGRCKKYAEMEAAVVEMTSAGFKPDLKIYTTVVTAYALAGDELKLREWFGRVKEEGLAPDLKLWTTFLYGLGKAGQYGAMMAGLAEMKESGVEPNEATYTAVLDALFGGAQYKETISAFRDMEAAELRTDRATFRRLCKQLSMAHRALRKAEGGGEDEGKRPGAWAPEKLAAIEEYERAVKGLLKEIEEDDDLDWAEEEDDDEVDVIAEGADVSGDVGQEGLVESAAVLEQGADVEEGSTGGLEDEWVGMVAGQMRRGAAGGEIEKEAESVSSIDEEEEEYSPRDAAETVARRLADAEALVKAWTAEDEEGGLLESADEGETLGGEEEEEELKEGDEGWVWEDEEKYLEELEDEEFDSIEDFLAADADDMEADFEDDFDPNVDYRKLLKEGKVKQKE